MASPDIKLEGVFCDYTILRPDGTVREKLQGYNNMILDQGLEALLAVNSGSTWSAISTCELGTGTQEPQELDVALTSPVGSASNNRLQFSATWSQPQPGIYMLRRSWRFDFDTAGSRGIAGVQLSEIGTRVGTTLISKSLIKDAQGNPTTIQLLPEEILQVNYALHIYFDAREPRTGTFTLDKGPEGSDTYNYSWNFMALTEGTNINYGWPHGILLANTTHARESTSLIAPESSWQGTASGGSPVTRHPYVPGSFKRTYSMNYSVTQFNLTGGIGGLRLYTGSTSRDSSLFQITFENPITEAGIPKTSDYRLDFNEFFHITLGRYTPEE